MIGDLAAEQAGLDSLGAVELRNAVAAKFGIALPATVAFDFPTAAALAGFVRGALTPAPDLANPQVHTCSSYLASIIVGGLIPKCDAQCEAAHALQECTSQEEILWHPHFECSTEISLAQ